MALLPREDVERALLAVVARSDVPVICAVAEAYPFLPVIEEAGLDAPRKRSLAIDYLSCAARNGYLGALAAAKAQGLLNAGNATDVYVKLVDELTRGNAENPAITEFYDMDPADQIKAVRAADWILKSFNFSLEAAAKIHDAYAVTAPTPPDLLLGQLELLPLDSKQASSLLSEATSRAQFFDFPKEVTRADGTKAIMQPLPACAAALRSAEEDPASPEIGSSCWLFGMMFGRYISHHGVCAFIDALALEDPADRRFLSKEELDAIASIASSYRSLRRKGRALL
jgi:hypothetical protein